MIQKLIFSIVLIMGMYYVGRMSSFWVWSQRRPIITASSARSTTATFPVRNSEFLDIPMASEYANYRVGDRTDVLAKSEREWNIVAMDAVVTKTSSSTIRLTIKKEHWMTVQAASFKSNILKLQRTISPDESPVAAQASTKQSPSIEKR